MFIPRLCSTIVLLLTLYVALFEKGPGGLAVFLFLGALLAIAATREFSNLLLSSVGPVFHYETEFAAVAMVVLPAFFRENPIRVTSFGGNAATALVLYALFGVYCWSRLTFSGNAPGVLRKAVVSCAALFLYILPLSFLTQIYLIGYEESYVGLSLTLFLLLVTKGGDIGAYCVGTWSSRRSGGNHKIVPSISPKKSWEGTIGGLCVSIVVAVIIVKTTMLTDYLGFFSAVIFGTLLFIGGFLGDLSESALKRTCGAKDSGRLVPGIGGALDLVDSLTLNAPLFYLFLMIKGF